MAATVNDQRVVMDPPQAGDEQAWIRWAQIALTFDGVDKALDILGDYLALNPNRADQLAKEWNDARARDGQPGLEEPDNDQAGADREDLDRAP